MNAPVVFVMVSSDNLFHLFHCHCVGGKKIHVVIGEQDLIKISFVRHNWG